MPKLEYLSTLWVSWVPPGHVASLSHQAYHRVPSNVNALINQSWFIVNHYTLKPISTSPIMIVSLSSPRLSYSIGFNTYPAFPVDDEA